MNQKLENKNKEIYWKEESKDEYAQFSEIDNFRNSPNLKINDFKLNEEIKEESYSDLSDNSFRVVVKTSAHLGRSKIGSNESAYKNQDSNSDSIKVWGNVGDKNIWLNNSWITVEPICKGIFIVFLFKSKEADNT